MMKNRAHQFADDNFEAKQAAEQENAAREKAAHSAMLLIMQEHSITAEQCNEASKKAADELNRTNRITGLHKY